jgi:hypothetical protein
LRLPRARPRAASPLPPTGVGGWRGLRGWRRDCVPARSIGELRRARDPPLLRGWIPWEEPMI